MKLGWKKFVNIYGVSQMRVRRTGNKINNSPFLSRAVSSFLGGARLVGGHAVQYLLDLYPGASAGYSLRQIGSGPVVRLRRGSDSAESDFTAAEIVAGTAGSEILSNGDFATDTVWGKGANWTITGGQAVSDGTVNFGYLGQNGVISDQAGVYYLITFDIVACSDFIRAGTVIDNGSIQNFSSKWGISSTGTYSAIFKTLGTNTSFNFYTETGVTMTIDNVSCKPYTLSAAELWAANDRSKIHRQGAESAFVTTWYDQSASREQVFPDTTLQTPANFQANGNSDTSTAGAFTITASEYSAINSNSLPDFTEVGKVYKVEFDYYTDNTANDFLVRGLGQVATSNPIPASTTPVTASFVWECTSVPNSVAVQTDGTYNGTTLTWTAVRVTDIGNPATQSTAASQPKLITAGVTETENGKAAIVFDGVDDYFDITSEPISVLNNLMVTTVLQSDGGSNEWGVTLSEPIQRVYIPYTTSGNQYIGYYASATVLDDGAIITDQQLVTLSVDASTASGFSDGAAFSVTPTTAADSGATIVNTNVPQIDAYGGGG